MEDRPGAGLSRQSRDVVELVNKHNELLKQYGDRILVYELDGFDLDVLHGVVALAVDTDGYERLSPQKKKVVDRFRGFCKRVWMGQGLTPDEAKTLDEMKVVPEALGLRVK